MTGAQVVWIDEDHNLVWRRPDPAPCRLVYRDVDSKSKKTLRELARCGRRNCDERGLRAFRHLAVNGLVRIHSLGGKNYRVEITDEGRQVGTGAPPIQYRGDREFGLF